MKKLLSFSFFILLLLSSGNYAPPAASDPSYTPPVETARPKKQKDLESLFFNMNRKGVSINKVKALKDKFEVEGTYKKTRNFDFFVEKVKAKSKSRDSVKVKKWKTHFAGKATQHYKVSGDNSW